ncbi:MAG: AI-2E family transporter [Gammaproteobacteria bacterium]|nr:AI-2E family transporter [Gammaproteobacteria bacterium]
MLLEDLAEAKWLKRLIVATLLAALVLLAVMILKPFVVPVIWATILAYVCWPLNQRLVVLMKGRRSVAALLMTLLLSAAIILPIVWFVFLVRAEAMPLVREIGPLLPLPTSRFRGSDSLLRSEDCRFCRRNRAGSELNQRRDSRITKSILWANDRHHGRCGPQYRQAGFVDGYALFHVCGWRTRGGAGYAHVATILW